MNSKKVIILFLIILSFGVLYFLIGNNIDRKRIYKTEISGEISDLRNIGRGTSVKQIKLTKDSKFCNLCEINVGENQENLQIGDSIFKMKNSFEYSIFRKKDGKFYFYIKLISPFK